MQDHTWITDIILSDLLAKPPTLAESIDIILTARRVVSSPQMSHFGVRREGLPRPATSPWKSWSRAGLLTVRPQRLRHPASSQDLPPMSQKLRIPLRSRYPPLHTTSLRLSVHPCPRKDIPQHSGPELAWPSQLTQPLLLPFLPPIVCIFFPPPHHICPKFAQRQLGIDFSQRRAVPVVL